MKMTDHSRITNYNFAKKEENVRSEILIQVYIILLALFGICLFLYGFLPADYNQSGLSTTGDIPQYIGRYRVKSDELYQPMVEKLVIMVIDAMRWDFISNPARKNAMPHLHSLINNQSACVLQASVNPPTVTMPRIKAITSGTIPGFMDVIFNFGNKVYNGDSILQQTLNQKKKIVFYGDDTWLKLFPKLFERYDGTTSFFVTDYTEVDNNVTRHLDKELNANDWTLMILHYLGLDHIGHTEGPYSQLIEPKLAEMDQIINRIHKQISLWNENNIPAILMICGDHGMKDSGGHGGSSLQETLVPLIFTGTKCSTNLNEPKTIAQIDVASTLSVLLGIPIPKSNIGKVSLEVLNSLSTSKKLFILHYNAQQMLQHFQLLSDYKNEDAYKNYMTAKKLHIAWLNTNGQNDEIVEDIVQMYSTALDGMKSILSSKIMKCDIFITIIAIILILHALQILIYAKNDKEISVIYIWLICFIYTLTYCGLKQLFHVEEDLADDSRRQIIILLITISFISCINFIFTKYTRYSLQTLPIAKIANDPMHCLFYYGSILHVVSLGSSSFIEEEHQTWYYLWSSFLSMILYRYIINIKYTKIQRNLIGSIIQVVMFFAMHRILRKLNSTGDKYAHLPDIADWLQNEQSKILMSAVLIIGLLLLVIVGYRNTVKKPKIYSLFLYTFTSICIYTRHMNNESVISFNISNWISNGINIFWLLLTIDLLYDLILIINTVISKKKDYTVLLTQSLLRNWIMISALLHRPHNVILLFCLLLNSNLIFNVFDHSKERLIKIVRFHIWLGCVYHFYQGNSNNLATIDIAAGYVGLKAYNPIITGLFLVINTFSATILSYFIILYKLAQSNECLYSTVLQVNKQYIAWRLLPMITSFIMVDLQRYHLFIWTVFFPKLLYEVAHCSIMFIIILIFLFLLNIHR